MSNPIKAFHSYFGFRPKGRSLSVKERFQTLSVHSLSKPVLPTALKWAAIPVLGDAVADLVGGRDTRFSEMFLMFVIMLLINIAGIKLLQAAGRKNKAAGTY